MGDSIVNGPPTTPAEALRKKAHQAWLAVVLAELLPALQARARRMGYALAAHGSLARDVDLIAVPWTEEASSAESLINALLKCVQEILDSGYIEKDRAPAAKPHGRLSYVIHIGPKGYLDISVMPKRAKRRSAK